MTTPAPEWLSKLTRERIESWRDIADGFMDQGQNKAEFNAVIDLALAALDAREALEEISTMSSSTKLRNVAIKALKGAPR